MEFVLGSFSCFNIEIAYSNFTFCGAWTPILSTFRWKMWKIHKNEHTDGPTKFHGKLYQITPQKDPRLQIILKQKILI